MAKRKFLIKTTKGVRKYEIKPKNLKILYERIGKQKGRIIYQRKYFRNLASITYDFRRKSKDSPQGLDIKVWSTNNRPTKVLKKLKEKRKELAEKWIKTLKFSWDKGGLKFRVFKRIKPGQDVFGVEGEEENVTISKGDNDAFRKMKWIVSFIGPNDEGQYKIFEEDEEKL